MIIMVMRNRAASGRKTNLYTTYPALADKQASVEVTMMGQDDYSQTVRSGIDKSAVIGTQAKLKMEN